jgi:hypothetical protein
MANSPAPTHPNPEEFNNLLDDEFHASLDRRLGRDFIDGIVARVENPIRQQTVS